MNKISLKGMEFINEVSGGVNINFSTAENEVNFKKENKDGIKNIEKLKEIFKLNDIYYINQVHSDIVVDSSNKGYKGNIDGDAIVFQGKNIGVGVFTADCVPVIVYDSEKDVIGAIHSGWKGTYDEITRKTCEYMISKYNCTSLNVVIGPHIRNCCYEVSIELAKKFEDKFSHRVIDGRYLNLEQCIFEQLKGLMEVKNVKSLNKCTYCNDEVKFHSYRKQNEQSGRLFSFVFIK